MSEWQVDLAASSLDEVWKWQAENRAWSKEIRQRISALVDSRLANMITQVDYFSTRKRFEEDAVECRRRTAILNQRIDQGLRSAGRRPN